MKNLLQSLGLTLSEKSEIVLELGVLVFLFVFGCLMLAWYPQREEMARYIENGAVIGILARCFGTSSKTAPDEKKDNPQ